MVSLYQLIGTFFIFSFACVSAKKNEVLVVAEDEEKQIDRTIQLRTHTIFPPYIDQDLQNRWWDFGADAYIFLQNTNKHIRLTRDVPSQMGWLWSRLPLTANHWQIETEFKISGTPAHLYGDGLAMWLTSDRAKPGPTFGSISRTLMILVLANFNGLGIFIDTYSNARHNYSFPRIMAVVGNGQPKYNKDDDGESSALAACSASLRRTNVATKLRLTYIHDGYLDLKIQYKAWDEWTPCFHVPKVKLPANTFLGFSAETGDVSDAHDIISVSTSSLLLTAQTGRTHDLKSTKKPVREHISGLFSFSSILKFVFFGAVVALAGVAARTYARQRGGLVIGKYEVLNRMGGLSMQTKSHRRF
ncbi:hypothetical protein M422DRAFT_43911 [Sphaerobolus stellatus SS14]|nr:hypothetical protein M422DRAFT_43911 [Sphaerobolus stellatus SS14]